MTSDAKESSHLLQRPNTKNDSANINLDKAEEHAEHLKKLVKERLPIRRIESSFMDDVVNFRDGSIPQSIVVAITNAIICGIGAYLYYIVMIYLIELFWHTLPEKLVVDVWPEWAYVLWIPLVAYPMAIGLGLTVVFLGEPGDLAYTIKCVHVDAFVHLNHVMPMVISSLFSIIGGSSVGPEAPLVAICAALSANTSKYIFKQTNKNIMRKHTLMGMAGALGAFFGCPLGGSIFALEVCSKFAIEYFEHVLEAILCGVLTCCVFRKLTGEVIGQVWDSKDVPMEYEVPEEIAEAAMVGLVGAAFGALFMFMHSRVLAVFDNFGLLNNKYAVWRALIGCTVIVLIGMIIPATMFWGEAEFETLFTLSPMSTLKHVFPTAGLIGFEMDSFGTCIIFGLAKLVTISFSVAGGYRGGFIFPLFSAGAAFGRALCFLYPSTSLKPTVVSLCMAAGLNVAITKTTMATTLILVYLSGEQNAMSAVLSASLVSIFATSYMPFIMTQVDRADETIEVVDLVERELDSVHNLVNNLKRNTSNRMSMSHSLLNSTISTCDEEHAPVDEVDLGSLNKSLTRHAGRSYIV